MGKDVTNDATADKDTVCIHVISSTTEDESIKTIREA